MSSITVSTVTILPARPTRLRLTARGRRVLLALAAVPLAGGIAFAALSGGSALASGESAASVSFETITVMPGDTLWSIAETVAPEADPREVIGEISRLNMLQGGTLQIGEELSIPAEFSN
jgi:LysM repeat protein